MKSKKVFKSTKQRFSIMSLKTVSIKYKYKKCHYNRKIKICKRAYKK